MWSIICLSEKKSIKIFWSKRKVIFEIIFHSCKILQYLRACSDLGRSMSGISKLLHKVEVWRFCFHSALLQNYLVKPRERNQCIFQFSFHLNWAMTEAVPGQIEENFIIMVLVKEKKKKKTKKRIRDSNFLQVPSLKDKNPLTINFSTISQQWSPFSVMKL